MLAPRTLPWIVVLALGVLVMVTAATPALLDGRLLPPISPWALWALAVLVVVAGALTAMIDVRLWLLGLILLAEAAFFVALPFAMAFQRIDTQGLPMFGWGVGWVMAYAAVSTAARAVGSQQELLDEAGVTAAVFLFANPDGPCASRRSP